MKKQIVFILILLLSTSLVMAAAATNVPTSTASLISSGIFDTRSNMQTLKFGSGSQYLKEGTNSNSKCVDLDAELKIGGRNIKKDKWQAFNTIEEFQIRGETTGIYAGTNVHKTKKDYCKSPQELVEYSCSESGYLTFKVVTCPTGCADGACLTLPYCIDTDKGIQKSTFGKSWYIVQGKVPTGQTGKCQTVGGIYICFLEEYCEGNTLHEFSCLKEVEAGGDYVQETTIDCAAGCNNGKCDLEYSVVGSEKSSGTTVTTQSTKEITLTLDQEQTINGKKVKLVSLPPEYGVAASQKAGILIESSSSSKSSGETLNIGSNTYTITLAGLEVILSGGSTSSSSSSGGNSFKMIGSTSSSSTSSSSSSGGMTLNTLGSTSSSSSSSSSSGGIFGSKILNFI